MSRRRFLQAGAGIAAGALPWTRVLGSTPSPASTSSPLKRLGAPAPFDYAQLKGLARSMAAAAYKPPSIQLPAPIARLGWAQWRATPFRESHSPGGGRGSGV